MVGIRSHQWTLRLRTMCHTQAVRFPTEVAKQPQPSRELRFPACGKQSLNPFYGPSARQGALPDPNYRPAFPSKGATDTSISSAIAANAPLPKRLVATRNPTTSRAPMPETAVYEKCCFELRPGKVRFPLDRPLFTVANKSVFSKQAAHRHLGGLVSRGLHRSHDLRSRLSRYPVHVP
jgi:hypothetical protein